MRKLSLFLVVLALLVVSVVPALAQEAPPTIAETVVAAAGGDAPEFTTLLAAVQAADPAILELLSNPDANLTVFAPTDAAFAAALEALDMTAEEVLGSAELLNDVLMYHVVPGRFDAASVIALDGAVLGTALPNAALAIALDGESVKINDATVVSADVAASNGIIHVIDAVLLPPMEEKMMEDEMMAEAPLEAAGTIADVVVSSASADAPEFTTLLAAVQAADPSVLATLTNGGPFTVFAPTDAAFAAAIEALGTTPEELLGNTALLTQVLAYHVIPGSFDAATVTSLPTGTRVGTLLPGTAVTLTIGDSVMVDSANVVATDVLADNGIVHVIDSVILPPME